MGSGVPAFVVDGMLSQHEIVVQGFDAPHGTLPGSARRHHHGDGVPALILDLRLTGSTGEGMQTSG